jgi:hypothetical protein
MILAGIAALNCVMVFLAFRKIPIEEHEEKVEEMQGGDDFNISEQPVAKRGRFVQVMTMRFTWTVALFLLFYVGTGSTLGGWGYTFLTTARNGDPVQMGRVSTFGFPSEALSKVANKSIHRLCLVIRFVF